MTLRPPCSTLFPYTTLFRSLLRHAGGELARRARPSSDASLSDRSPQGDLEHRGRPERALPPPAGALPPLGLQERRSEEHTSELQSQSNLVCRLLLEKKKKKT